MYHTNKSLLTLEIEALTADLADVEKLLKENQAMLENLEVGSFEFSLNDTTNLENDLFADPSFEEENDRIKTLLESFISNQEIASEIAKEIKKPNNPLTPDLKSESFNKEDKRIKELLESFISNQEVASEIGKYYD